VIAIQRATIATTVNHEVGKRFEHIMFWSFVLFSRSNAKFEILQICRSPAHARFNQQNLRGGPNVQYHHVHSFPKENATAKNVEYDIESFVNALLTRYAGSPGLVSMPTYKFNLVLDFFALFRTFKPFEFVLLIFQCKNWFLNHKDLEKQWKRNQKELFKKTYCWSDRNGHQIRVQVQHILFTADMEKRIESDSHTTS
jgi:hypothetical protein